MEMAKVAEIESAAQEALTQAMAEREELATKLAEAQAETEVRIRCV